MSNRPRILWLEGVFDEPTIDGFPAISPAVNFWHDGFVKALISAGCDVTLVGHPHDRVWPWGRALIRSGDGVLAAGFSGQVAGYLNFPLLRTRSQEWNYLRLVKAYVATYGRPDYVYTFNDTPATPAARYLSQALGVPWIYIAGDGPVLPGANGYLYQNWVYFEASEAPGPKIHLDGGLPNIGPMEGGGKEVSQSRALMYMGALTEHGGAVELTRAFRSLDDTNIELWITGRGTNKEIEKLATQDSRIKLYGFLSQQELHTLASRARVFANPRPSAFVPNKLNYPSKLLHYLSYGRPVLSTFTDGLSPDYKDVLIPIEQESEEGLVDAIRHALLMDDVSYSRWCSRVVKFNASRTWSGQVGRLLGWMERDLKRECEPTKTY